ncbi:MAG: hypothetical protein IKR91_07315 [Alloprevotella sp.]|nr:hypothetical protein [Alloprevotella sp.]
MAKKTEPTEMSVEQKLKALFQLQTTLSEIDRIKTLRGELPLEVQDLEDEIEGLKTRVNKYEEEIAGLNTDQQARLENIKKAEALIERYNKQLDDVKNNREYDMLMKEIEFQKYEIDLLNKRTSEAADKIDQRQKDVEACKATIAERQEDLDVKRNELDEIVAETKSEEEKLREKAKEYEAQIDERTLNSFKRIRRSSRNGLGIVYVQRDACGGCFNKIPPQRQLDVRLRKKMIVCEYCGRILIDPELAGVKTEAPKAEKPKRKTTRKTTKKKTEE